MINKTVIVLVALATLALVTAHMNESERIKVMNKFVNKPVQSTVEIDQKASYNQNLRDPYNAKTYIKISPPRGYEFIVTKDPNEPDIRVSKEKSIPLHLKNLSKSGQLSLRISSGPKDEGYVYSWNTPHRLASVISVDGTKEGISDTVAVMSCVAHKASKEKKIILTLLSGERWTIEFPEKDEFVEGSIFAVKDPATAHTGELVEKPKATDPVNKYWSISNKGAYVISGNRFYIDGVSGGSVGQCRYRYSGAPDDKESGIIECHNVGKYDVLLTHLECTKSLNLR